MHFFQPILVRGLEAMESELLQEMKIMNGALDKEPRTLTGEIFVEAGGFRYNTNLGCMHGNTIDPGFSG